MFENQSKNSQYLQKQGDAQAQGKQHVRPLYTGQKLKLDLNHI
mgnify:CR=1 FL=1